MKKRATVSDVAKASGVSVSTVSRALNQPDLVKDATLRRIHKAMGMLGFELPNEAVCSPLPAKFSPMKLILVILPNLANQFYSKIIDGISDSASRQNVRCVVYQSKRELLSSDELYVLLHTLNASGLILLDPVLDAPALERLDQMIPVVQCSEFLSGCKVSYVSIDDFAATKSLIELMLSRGKKRIALINGPSRFKYAKMRRAGYIAAMEKNNMPIDETLLVNLPEISYRPAFSLVTQLLTSDNPPDSCFAVSDIFAAAAIKAAKCANLRIPDDFGIAGFDNTDIATLCDPAITTVSQPCYRMGYISAEILIERMTNPLSSPKQLMLETELIIRKSL